jgi:uncharacterized membrane protein YhaH (DUF805 family)
MDSLALFFSASGRIARKPFAICVAVVYVLIFASQLLLSPAVTLRLNVLPFALLQGALTFAWYALHAKRLRDGGYRTGVVVGLAILYAMSVVLFILLIELVLGVNLGSGKNSGSDFASLVLVIFLVAMFTGEPGIGLFFYLATVILVLIFIPLLIATGFSFWAGARVSAPP